MRQLQCLLYNNDCYKKGKTMTPTRIVVHSTGAPNSSLKRYVQPHATQTDGMKEYRPVRKTYTRDQMMDLLGKNIYSNDWNRGGLYVCVNAFIGELADGSIATVQTLPWAMCPWGVGAGRNGSFNDCAIQFEICEDDHSSEAYCKATFKEAVELCALLCKTYSIPADNIVSHREAHLMGYGSNHGDPDNWWPKFGLSMDKFRAAVKAELGEDAPVVTKPAESSAFNVGDEIQLVSGAKYTSGGTIPNWVINSKLYVRELQGDNVVFSTLKTGAITGVVNKKYIVGNEEKEVPTTNAKTPYLVRVTADVLNIRKGAGTGYDIVGQITNHGTYTIVEENNGWGRLKSGIGWIYLDYTQKV